MNTTTTIINKPLFKSTATYNLRLVKEYLVLSSLLLCISDYLIAPAYAAPLAANQGDVFARKTSSSQHPISAKSASATKPITFDPRDPDLATHWFDAYDNLIDTLHPTAQERAILTEPFNQNPDRVNRWIVTAHGVAVKYRQLAAQLKAMQIPARLNNVQELRDLTADWYNDAALIYEDLIRPRRPAKTREELDHTLAQIKERADTLAQSNGSLHALDTSLRKSMSVHLALRDDPIRQFVSGK
jgi:hypothetical protein